MEPEIEPYSPVDSPLAVLPLNVLEELRLPRYFFSHIQYMICNKGKQMVSLTFLSSSVYLDASRSLGLVVNVPQRHLCICTLPRAKRGRGSERVSQENRAARSSRGCSDFLPMAATHEPSCCVAVFSARVMVREVPERKPYCPADSLAAALALYVKRARITRHRPSSMVVNKADDLLLLLSCLLLFDWKSLS